MSNENTIWTTAQVEQYLKKQPQNTKLTLPNNAYATKDFAWNEVLMTGKRNIDMPSRQILDNLKSTTDVLQAIRSEIKAPMTITDSWRTPSELNNLIKLYNEGRAPNKPSPTSLHLEGFAIDFFTHGKKSQKEVQDRLNKIFMGELEYGSNYTHIGLTTFSEGYLKRRGINNDKIFQKLSTENVGFTSSELERLGIIKRMDARTWKPLPSIFDSKENIEIFGNGKLNFKTSSISQDVPIEQSQLLLEGGIWVSKKQNIFDGMKSGTQNFFGRIKGLFDTSYGELGVEAGGASGITNDLTLISYPNSYIPSIESLGNLNPDLPSDFRASLLATYNEMSTPKTFKETLTDKLSAAKDFLADKGMGIAMGLSSFIGRVQGLVEIIKAPAKGVLGWIGKTLGIVNAGLSLVNTGFGRSLFLIPMEPL